jgi:hypothetical protein
VYVQCLRLWVSRAGLCKLLLGKILLLPIPNKVTGSMHASYTPTGSLIYTAASQHASSAVGLLLCLSVVCLQACLFRVDACLLCFCSSVA